MFLNIVYLKPGHVSVRGNYPAFTYLFTETMYRIKEPVCGLQEENVSSVSWNTWCDDLLSMSSGSTLSIKAGSFPPASHPLVGSVVGFQVHHFYIFASMLH